MKPFRVMLQFSPVYLTELTQPAITYSKLTIETLEQGVKYVQSSHLVLLLLTSSSYMPRGKPFHANVVSPYPLKTENTR